MFILSAFHHWDLYLVGNQPEHLSNIFYETPVYRELLKTKVIPQLGERQVLHSLTFLKHGSFDISLQQKATNCHEKSWGWQLERIVSRVAHFFKNNKREFYKRTILYHFKYIFHLQHHMNCNNATIMVFSRKIKLNITEF